MSYQCEHDDEQQTPDPANCVWCLLNLEYSLRILGHNLAAAGALCAAHQIGERPPVTYHRHQTQLRHIEVTVPDVWYPGCGRAVEMPDDGWDP